MAETKEASTRLHPDDAINAQLRIASALERIALAMEDESAGIKRLPSTRGLPLTGDLATKEW